MIAFIGSVFSPYYHWSGRGDPENHVAFNVALYGPEGHSWAMTERGRAALDRSANVLRIGNSRLTRDGAELSIDFDEMFLPWPGQRWWPKRMRGQMVLSPRFAFAHSFALDGGGFHHWSPILPSARVRVTSADLPGGGWSGEGYHDTNWGSRPIERDFIAWDWGRGHLPDDGGAVLVYDAERADGGETRLGLRFDGAGACEPFALAERQVLPRGFWGVGGGVASAPGKTPRLLQRLEDSPFYRRSIVETCLDGQEMTLMHETLDCRRLAMPLVKMMLPFRMPRRA